MAYRYDENLEFLSRCSSESLDDLVYCLTHDVDGELRYTESLTNTNEYKRFYPDHNKYWELIAGEIQCFGGNTIINIIRGGGVKYREVLTDVCDILRVKYNATQSIDVIELNMLMKILEESMENMSAGDITKLIKMIDLKQKDDIFTPQTAISLLKMAIKLGRIKPYNIAHIVSNSVCRQLFNRENDKKLEKYGALLITYICPVINAYYLSGPAYRVTIPATIQVALLRTIYS